MTEPAEPQTPTEPQEPAEAPETPQEPPEAPDAPDTPDEGEERAEASEDEPSTVQPQPKSEKDMEKVFKALDNEAMRHAKRVGDILEEDAQDLIPCELCAKLLPGFRWPVVDEDQRAAVMLAIGFEPKPDLEPDKHAHACPDCHGHGKVATGSKVQGQDALPCLTCGGNGWMGERRQMTTRPAAAPVAAPPWNGPPELAPSDPEREALQKLAKEQGGFIVWSGEPAAT